ncbi:MAG: hypothetical protein EA426_16615 [Spirochaetaceae bacterium]|nr:MAG: hypothetical protein EA426_16615 [Spirochaetaceae bacterium]
MGEKRKTYSKELKEQAVELLNTSGKPGNPIEAELGIGNGVAYRWRRQMQEAACRFYYRITRTWSSCLERRQPSALHNSGRN